MTLMTLNLPSYNSAFTRSPVELVVCRQVFWLVSMPNAFPPDVSDSGILFGIFPKE